MCGLPPILTLQVSFSWWRHLRLSFVNLVLRFAVVPSTWKSSMVVPVINRDGDPTSLDSYRPTSLSSCALKKCQHLICARIAPHTLPQLDPSQVGIRWCSLVAPCACAAMSTPLPLFVTLRRLLIPAGSKPLFSVSSISVSWGLFGTHLLTSCVGLCPRSVLVALSPPWVKILSSGSSHFCSCLPLLVRGRSWCGFGIFFQCCDDIRWSRKVGRSSRCPADGYS